MTIETYHIILWIIDDIFLMQSITSNKHVVPITNDQVFNLRTRKQVAYQNILFQYQYMSVCMYVCIDMWYTLAPVLIEKLGVNQQESVFSLSMKALGIKFRSPTYQQVSLPTEQSLWLTIRFYESCNKGNKEYQFQNDFF